MAKWDNFTADRVAGFKCEPGKRQSIYWDGKAPGLGLRVTSAGTKAYIFETRLHGHTMRITIGDVRTWPIGKAQAEATSLKALTDQGIDPRQQRAERAAVAEAKREEAKRLVTPALDAWQAYVDARRAKWSPRHLLEHDTVCKEGGEPRGRGRRAGDSNMTLPGILRPLLILPLAQIDADRVRAWLQDEAPHRPTYARLAFALLRAFLNWCSDRPEYRDHVHSDACTSRMARDELPKKAAKDDCLQREQLLSWFAAVRQIQNPVIATYLQALLLSGARREELAGLTWDDVDFEWKSMTIKDKVDGERTIPLTPYVGSLLAFLPRRNQWVFSSPAAASGRLQEPRIQHNKALTTGGLPALSLHGLRRSFGTMAEWVECPAGVSAQIMGHKPSATAERHYRVRSVDLLRMWHTKIEAWILAEAGIEQPTEAQSRLRVASSSTAA